MSADFELDIQIGATHVQVKARFLGTARPFSRMREKVPDRADEGTQAW